MFKCAIALFFSIIGSSAFAQNSGDVICSYAPSQSKSVSAVAGTAGGIGVATAAIAQSLGLSVVAHSSGALILTGSGGYIAGTLGTAIVAPVVIAVGVVIGGSAITVELVCAPRNHPEYVAKVEAAATAFKKRWDGMFVGMKAKASERIGKVTIDFKNVTDNVFEYVYRKQ